MKRSLTNLVLTLLFAAFPAICCGQAFVARYPQLTEKNLPEFFKEWKAYSDSMALHATVCDSAITRIMNQEAYSELFAKYRTDDGSTPRYCVMPQTVDIYRYPITVDTANLATYSLYGHGADTIKIIPPLPPRGLYLTPRIDSLLSEYIGGLLLDESGLRFSEINEEHEKEIEGYISLTYGHWGGCWHFYAYPQMDFLSVTDNLIITHRSRCAYCGDGTIYVKKGDSFVKCDGRQIVWMQ